MTDILQEIVERNRPLLEARKDAFPMEELRERALRAPKRASFVDAFRGHLAGEPPRIIAELKAASPSRGVIRKELPVERLAPELESAGASALSVLTEPLFFRGSLRNLRQAAQCTALPLLRKDFTVDEYQLWEAKAAGASAVLLIAALLSPERFRELLEQSHALGLEVLGEAHCAEELETAAQADLLGVNARDLKTFHTSLEHSARVLRLARRRLPEKPLVAESAVRTPEDLRLLAGAGADGFLVGERLMGAASPGAALEELRRWK